MRIKHVLIPVYWVFYLFLHNLRVFVLMDALNLIVYRASETYLKLNGPHFEVP